MGIELFRHDYTQVAMTVPKTTKLLPVSQNGGVQKVVVGDQEGVVHVFSLHHGQLQSVFKSLPSKPIMSVQLGGTPSCANDNIFVSTGASVLGYTRRGKQFLSLHTNLTDTIRGLCVSGQELLVCSEYVCLHFSNCRELSHHVNSDHILDIICLPVDKVSALIPVLACSDRSLHVLRSDGVRYQCETEGVPVCVQLLLGDGGASGEWLVYGTSDGTLASIRIGRTSAVNGWRIPGASVTDSPAGSDVSEVGGAGGSAGGVVCLHHAHSGGGLAGGDGWEGGGLLVVARDCGTVQLFGYCCQDAERTAPALLAACSTNECITSVQAGFISSAESAEILVTTQTGSIFGLTTAQRVQDAGPSSCHSPLSAANDTKRKILQLRAEVAELESSIQRERVKLEQSTGNPEILSPQLILNDKFSLVADEAAYVLTLHASLPIDSVLLQSDVPLDLVDVQRNSAVVSVCACDHTVDGNYILATYRCQADVSRLQICVRTIEGQYGRLRVYVTPRSPTTGATSGATSGATVCCSTSHAVAPLSLHVRTHSYDRSRPHSTLVLSGQFSMSEVHSWLRFCLPDMCDRCPSTDTATVLFRSVFLDTQLLVNYTRKRVEFQSDSISTIAIVKDVITREATKKSISLQISCDVSAESAIHTLCLLRPRLSEQLQLAGQVQLLQPLHELCEHEQDSAGTFLCDQYRTVLAQHSDIRPASSRHPASLERLYGMITDLYIDKFKFLGVNVKHRVSQLLEILYADNFDALVDFFNAPPHC